MNVLTPEEEEENKKEVEKRDWFRHKWGWLAWIDTLAAGHRINWDFFLKMNVQEFLNSIIYFNDLQQFRKEQNDQQLQKNHT